MLSPEKSSEAAAVPPSEPDLLGVLAGAQDILVVVVRGHQFLETLLDLAISEALAAPHAVEISRLSFSLKVDLSAALGVIPNECRPGFAKINAIRNKLAHDPKAVVTEDDARHAYNALSPEMRHAFGRPSDKGASVRHIVTRCIQILYVVLQESVTMMRDGRARMTATMELADETHQRFSKGRPSLDESSDPYYQAVSNRIDEKVRQDREERHAKGDL